jgi:hypothetical protein
MSALRMEILAAFVLSQNTEEKERLAEKTATK